MRRSLPLAALLVGAAMTLAACGGSSKPATPKTVSQQSAALALSRCMRANGVPNFPDPSSNGTIQAQGNGNTMTVNGVPVSAPAFQRATSKCAGKLPKGPALSASQISHLKQAAIKFAECMRAHGVPNFPDPQIQVAAGGQGIGVRMGAPGNSGINPRSPAFEKAQQECGSRAGSPFQIRVSGGNATGKAG